MSFQNVINITFSKAKENFLRFLPLYFIVYATDLLASNFNNRVHVFFNLVLSAWATSILTRSLVRNERVELNNLFVFKDLLQIKYTIILFFIPVIFALPQDIDENTRMSINLNVLMFIITFLIIHMYQHWNDLEFNLKRMLGDFFRIIKLYTDFFPTLTILNCVSFILGCLFTIFAAIFNFPIEKIYCFSVFFGSLALTLVCLYLGLIIFFPVMHAEEGRQFALHNYIKKTLDLTSKHFLAISGFIFMICFLSCISTYLWFLVKDWVMSSIGDFDYIIGVSYFYKIIYFLTAYMMFLLSTCNSYAFFKVIQMYQEEEKQAHSKENYSQN